MAAWAAGDERFDCEKCAKKPQLKKTLGCDAPPMASGASTVWAFPPVRDPKKARAVVDRCPRQLLTWDIVALLRTVNLAGDAGVSLTEQASLPEPYLEALALLRYEMSEADRVRRAQKEKLQ